MSGHVPRDESGRTGLSPPAKAGALAWGVRKHLALGSCRGTTAGSDPRSGAVEGSRCSHSHASYTPWLGGLEGDIPWGPLRATR